MKRWSARAGRARLRADHRRRRQHVVQRHPSRTARRVPLEPAASPRPRSPPNTRRPYSGALRRLYAWLGRPRARGRDPRRLLRLGAARESATDGDLRGTRPRRQVVADRVEPPEITNLPDTTVSAPVAQALCERRHPRGSPFRQPLGPVGYHYSMPMTLRRRALLGR